MYVLLCSSVTLQLSYFIQFIVEMVALQLCGRVLCRDLVDCISIVRRFDSPTCKNIVPEITSSGTLNRGLQSRTRTSRSRGVFGRIGVVSVSASYVSFTIINPG